MSNSAFQAVVARGWLSRQPDTFVREVIGISRLRRYRCGKIIVNQQDHGRRLFGILDGCAEMRVSSPAGDSVLIHLLWPGDWFGEGTVISEGAYDASIRARSDVVVTEVPIVGLRFVCSHDPERWRCIARLAWESYAFAAEAAAHLMLRDQRARCIAALLRLGGCRPVEPMADRTLRVPVSQEEVAAAANVCRNSAGAALRALEAQDLISVAYRNITILSAARLYRRLQEIST